MTAAINQNQTILGSSVTVYRDKTGKIVWTQSTADGGTIYRERRPASIHIPKDVTGWRNPGNWTHSGSRVVFPTGRTSRIDADGTSLVSDGDVSIGLANLGSLPNFPSWMEDAAVNQALNSLLGQGSINLGEDVGQYQQTVDMVTDKVHTIRRQAAGFKKKYPRSWMSLRTRGMRAGRRATNLWLEYEYGWKPLLMDVHGALQQLDELGHEPGQPRHRTVVRLHESNSKRVLCPASQGYWLGAGNTDMDVVDTMGVKVRIDFNVSNSVAHHLAATGLINPVDLVWELLPYSFVVDWFLPVGSYLTAWTAALGLTFAGGTISKFRERKVTMGGTRYSNPRTEYSYHGFSYRAYDLVRSTTGWTQPRIPHLKNPLSLTHFANAMSLLVGVFTDDGRIRPLV